MIGRRLVVAVAALTAVATGACGSGGGEQDVAPTASSNSSSSPVPYTERDVDFVQRVDGHTLAGTLSVPPGDGPHAAVVLITGSGSQDRDETIGTIKPFAALADRLARAGIAVLRFDDRGVGGSGGAPVEVSGATTRDLARDGQAAVEFLASQPEIDPARVGVVGHSEGGLIAPIVANDSDAVRFVVLLAGSAVPGAQILEQQTADITAAEGAPPEIVDWSVGWTRELIAISASDVSPAEAEAEMRRVASQAISSAPPGAVGDDADTAVEQTIAAFLDPWMRFFLAYDPVPARRSSTCPSSRSSASSTFKCQPRTTRRRPRRRSQATPMRRSSSSTASTISFRPRPLERSPSTRRSTSRSSPRWRTRSSTGSRLTLDELSASCARFARTGGSRSRRSVGRGRRWCPEAPSRRSHRHRP